MKSEWVVLDHHGYYSSRARVPGENVGDEVPSGNDSATVVGIYSSQREAEDNSDQRNETAELDI